MYEIAAGLLVLGVVCGATVRLPTFVIILLGAAAIAALSTGLRGDGNPVLSALIAALVLQAGYALGIVGRAVLRSWRQVPAGIERTADPRVRLPTEPKQQ